MFAQQLYHHRVTHKQCMTNNLWHGHYDNVPPLSLSPQHHKLSSTNWEVGRRGRGGKNTPTHRQAWHGNLSLMLMQRDCYTENLPASSSSASWDGSLVLECDERGGRPSTPPANSVTWCHQPWPQPGPRASTMHPRLWFIHHEASIIQAHNQVVPPKLSRLH